MKHFKISFAYWYGYCIDTTTVIDQIYSNIKSPKTENEWQDYDPDYLTVECEYDTFGVDVITKAYGDGSTDFIIEGWARSEC